MSDALVKSLREWPSMLRRTKAPLGEAIKDMQAAADRLERLQRDLTQANAELAAVRAQRNEFRSVLIELRLRLHAAGRRPEECAEMSMIDQAIIDSAREQQTEGRGE